MRKLELLTTRYMITDQEARYIIAFLDQCSDQDFVQDFWWRMFRMWVGSP